MYVIVPRVIFNHFHMGGQLKECLPLFVRLF